MNIGHFPFLPRLPRAWLLVASVFFSTAAAMRITNLAEANRFIGPGYEYRPGWGA